MKICRISKVKGFHGFIGGKDMANIFEDGHIYEVKKILGQIMFTDIGEHASTDIYGEEISMQPLNHIISNGTHLCTQKEIEEGRDKKHYE